MTIMLSIFDSQTDLSLYKYWSHMFLIILFILSFEAVIVSADAPNCSGWWDGQTQPYEISNIEDLQCMKADLSADYVLTTNIDASETETWNSGSGFVPVGDGSSKFTGSFDGQGFEIDGLFIEREGSRAGGLFGWTDNVVIEDIILSNINVSGTDQDYGGFVGVSEDPNDLIRNVSVSGVVDGSDSTGGIVGFGSFSGARIINSKVDVEVSGNNNVGGVVGYSSIEVINTLAKGVVSGNDKVGGLIGGMYYGGPINNSISLGSVSGNSNVSGLIGYNNELGDGVANSFWDVNTSGQTSGEWGTGKTTEELKNVSTFTDTSTSGLTDAWDFVGDPNDDGSSEDIWNIAPSENDGYPFLTPLQYEHELFCYYKQSCNADERVLGVENYSGGFVNSHAQLSNYTGDQYNYSLCCSSENQVVNESCSITGNEEVVRLSNKSNAHVQAPNVTLNSTVYDYPVCLAGNGRMDCAVSSSSPGSNYECMGSMASSENNSGDYNLTNAHVADCGYYQTNIYCRLNNKPTQDTPILNSSSGENLSQDNLTVYSENLTDLDGNDVTPVFDWRESGSSIAVLNMPFNNNVTSTNAGALRDYSSYENNATLGGGNKSKVPTWEKDCVFGGCYEFDGKDDIIDVGSIGISDSNERTVSIWVKPALNEGDLGGFVSSQSHESFQFLRIDGYCTGGKDIVLAAGFGSGTAIDCTLNNFTVNQWYHIAATYNGTSVKTYADGEMTVEDNLSSLSTNDNFVVGKGVFNGTIDSVKVYDKALSPEQIKRIYREGNASINDAYEHTKSVANEETKPADNYTVAVTPTDGIEDGQTLTSNSLYVRSLNVTTFAPSGGITDRKPVFNWSEDSSADRYELNVTAPSSVDCFGFYEDNITSSSFNSTQELCTDLDYDSSAESFTWKVRSCSGGSCSAWSNDSFDVNSVNSISLVNSSVSFGDLLPGDVDNTTNGSASPLVVRNEGNIRVDLEVSANESLFDNVALNNSNFQLQSGVNDANAFNETSSVSSWLNVTNSSQNLIKQLKYFETEQDANVDVRVEVPDQEPTGSKTSTITVESIPND